MLQSTVINISGQTNVGKVRAHNEDRILISPSIKSEGWFTPVEHSESKEAVTVDRWGSILTVADGMGGAEAGEVASSLAIASVQTYLSSISDIPAHIDGIQQLLENTILCAHRSIIDYVIAHPETKGMGTTIIIAWLIENTLFFAWSGDSRAYLYRPSEGFFLLTDDHSVVWEEVKRGNLSPEQARIHPDSNIITQALGDPQQLPTPEFRNLTVLAEDCILLCSDGLNGMIPDDQIAHILAQPHTLSDKSSQLIYSANEAGGGDNISVGMIEIMSVANHLASAKSSVRVNKKFRTFILLIISIIIAAALAIILCSY